MSNLDIIQKAAKETMASLKPKVKALATAKGQRKEEIKLEIEEIKQAWWNTTSAIFANRYRELQKNHTEISDLNRRKFSTKEI